MMKKTFICLLASFSLLQASTITWIAQSPNNDMNDTASWSPNTVPGSSDIAVFDSSVSGIATNPTESSAPFSVAAFNFSHLAAPFHCTFTNQKLAFAGSGITGVHTNPSISVINTNNSAFFGDMLSFAAAGTTGSADVTCSNTASLTGAQSGQSVGGIGSQVHVAGAYTIANGGAITARNSGLDSATALGGNTIAVGTGSQIQCDDSCMGGDNVTIVIENSGTFDGANTDAGDSVGSMQGHQFNAVSAFQMGDNFSCTVENSGTNSSIGVGNNTLGEIGASQMALNTTGIVGHDASITVTNTGINAAAAGVAFDKVAYLNDNQLFVGQDFQAGDRCALTVSNTGVDSSTGLGQNQVAVINSNSGTTGDQVLLLQGGTLGSNATINVTNSGTYTGTNTGGGCQVGGMNLGQFTVGDSTQIGSYTFSADDNFSLTVGNSGMDSTSGTGGDAVGSISVNQGTFFTPCSLGDQAQITITNAAHYTGNASTTYVNVGSVGSHQLFAASTFQAGDDFTLDITNSGINEGGGVGGYFIGDIITAQQADFEHGLTLGNNGVITITNTGSNAAATTNNNQVGSMMGYGAQLLVKEGLQAGDGLQLTITNSGVDTSTMSGSNFVGFINDNVSDSHGSQIHLADGGIVGDNASITVSSTGTLAGNNAGGNVIATFAGPQFASVMAFEAGNQFSFDVSMVGTNNASGKNNNDVAVLGGSSSSQVDFRSDCTVGDGASFIVANSGINHDASGTNNFVGYVTNVQMDVLGDFSAGTDLNIAVSNSATNVGDSSNFVGYVVGSQLSFAQGCTLGDGSAITVANSGTVGASQLLFNQGFDISSGKVTIQVTNTGDVTNHGIEINGSNAGGNAEITMRNTSLYIATSLPDFTIAGLTGDYSCSAQSQPTLIINRDNSGQSSFSGSIQDFSDIVPTVLTKTGAGTQILSGVNTYTGLTTIEEGFLVINGSQAGDVFIDADGALEGSGIINGTVTNTGTIAPGQSIGTMTVGNYVHNGGTYQVEVNGVGQSDRIHALGTATINGGDVEVSTVDGTYTFHTPYTIVTADASLTGTFSGAIASGFLTPILTYDANDVFLTINPALINAANSCNQLSVATNLDNLTNLNNAQSLLISTIAALPLKSAQCALESISGYQYTNEAWVTEISTSRFLRRLYDPLRSQVTACNDIKSTDWSTWLETGPDFAHVDGRNAHSTHGFSYQVTGGAQRYIARNFFLGLAGAYQHDHATYTNAHAYRNSGYVGLYGLYRPDRFYTLFDVAYGYTASHLTRTVRAGDLCYAVSGHPNVNTFAFYAECGADIAMKEVLLQPFAGIQVERNWRTEVTESTSTGWWLTIDEHTWTPVHSRLGFHLTTCTMSHYVDVSLDAAWDQRLATTHNTTEGRFQECSDSYCIYGNKLDAASVDYALTLTKCFKEAYELYVEFEGQWWGHANTNGVLAGLKYSW